MLPDRVSNQGPLTYESGALPIALRGPAITVLTRLENILTLKSYENGRLDKNWGPNAHTCYIRICVITNHVISRASVSPIIWSSQKTTELLP